MNVMIGHWMPKAFRGPGGAVAGAAPDPHGKPPRGVVASIFKLGWLWLNWWMAWQRGLGAAARRGFVLYDRYHVDLLIDARRYRYGGPAWLARLVSGWMPQPDLVVFLDASPEVLLARKREVGAEVLEQSRRAYLGLCTTNERFHTIDASQSLGGVIEEVLELLQVGPQVKQDASAAGSKAQATG